MLNFLQNKTKGLLTWCIMLLIIGAFAFFGLTDYFSGANPSFVAAKVNGQKITWRAVENFYERNFKQQTANLDERMVKDQVRTLLVQRTALLNQANKMGLRVGDEQIAKLLLQIPAFQKDGQFSKEQYLELIGQHGYTDAVFRQEMAQDVLLGQFENGLVLSNFILESELEQIASLIEQKRDFGYFQVSTEAYRKPAEVTAEEISALYESQKPSFVLPERVSLEIVQLSIDDLAKQMSVNAEDIAKYYEDHMNLYMVPERVRARHILISVQGNEPNADTSAKSKAEELMQKIKEGQDFAALAKENSADVGSAEKGGDLGWFVKGQMVPQFEEAVFSLSKPQELAGPIRTQFGYHLVQLVDRQASMTRPLDEVKSFIEQQVKREKAEQNFAEKSELLSKLAFENATSLDPIAKQMGLKIEVTPLFDRQGNGENASRRHPEMITAAFSEDLLKRGNNSMPIKINEGTVAIVRVSKHEPSQQQTLEQVSEKIRNQLANEKAFHKIKDITDKIVARLKAGDEPVTLGNEYNLTWISKKNIGRQAEGIDKQISSVLFAIPHPEGDKPTVTSFPLASGEMIILGLQKIIPGSLDKVDDKTKVAYGQSIREITSQLEYALYAQQVLNRSKIEIIKTEE